MSLKTEKEERFLQVCCRISDSPYSFVLSRRIMEAHYKTIPFEKIVTHRFLMEETAEAVETARSGKCMKAVLVPT